MVNRLDPRRGGFVALVGAATYGVTLFLDETLTFRVVCGLVVGAALVAVALVAPLPAWREAEERKRTAASAMVFMAGVMAAAATIARILTR